MVAIDSLADPIRLAVARHLAGNPGATAPEIADAVGVHLNTVRAHLAALERDGRVERSTRGGRVGRPAVRYRLGPDWQEPRGDELLGLSSLLAGAAREGADPRRLRESAAGWGRRWSRGAEADDPKDRLVGALRRLGFTARVDERSLRLSGCPCPVVSPEGPAFVCGLVDAVVDGILEGTGVAAGPRDHDPAARRCSTQLSNSPN